MVLARHDRRSHELVLWPSMSEMPAALFDVQAVIGDKF